MFWVNLKVELLWLKPYWLLAELGTWQPGASLNCSSKGFMCALLCETLKKSEAVLAAVGNLVAPAGRVTFAVADLGRDEGWTAAVAGCDYVLHVASPLGEDNPKDANELIIPAREGTLRVLRAAVATGVKRVVMTSAANAASPSSYESEGVTDEALWTVDDVSMPAYRRSKTLAERAAWDFMSARSGATSLTTILPGAVFGPILSTSNLGSVRIIARMLEGKMPGCPKIGLEVVDVRDLARLHVLAMTSPDAAGERFLGTGEFVWMKEIAQDLRNGLGAAAAKVRTRELPNFLVRLAARRDPGLQAISISLGRRNRHSTAKAAQILGWEPRPAREAVVDCGRSLIAAGVLG